jgi:hypothetical protein
MSRARPSTDHALRWLAFLATSLDRLGLREFTWWRLEKMMATWLRVLLVVVAAAVPIGVVAISAGGGLTPLVAGALVVSAAGALAAAGYERGVTRLADGTSSTSLRIERRWSLGIAAVAILAGIVFGAAWGVVCFGLVWSSPWSRWLLAKVVFAVRGRLPLALMAFLDDARRRAVLRTDGPGYRFAHYLLQQNLSRPGAKE